MHCPDCGQEKEQEDSPCPHCSQSPKVTVLSPREREQFQGVTLNQDEESGQEEYRSNTRQNTRVYVRHVTVSGGSFGRRLLIAIAILAFLAGLVFVALPIVLIVIAIIVAVSFILRLLS